MAIELLFGVIGTVASVAGVWVGYMQYKHQKAEAEHIRTLVGDREGGTPPEAAKPVATPQPPEPKKKTLAPVLEAAESLLPKPTSPTAGLESALIVAREMSAPYDRDKKRGTIFEEALRRRQFAFAASVIVDFENAYDRERCKDALAGAMSRVNNPALALEVARILSGKQ